MACTRPLLAFDITRDILEMLVKHIQNAVCHSPEEKQGSHKYERDKIAMPVPVSEHAAHSLNMRSISCHLRFDGVSGEKPWNLET